MYSNDTPFARTENGLSVWEGLCVFIVHLRVVKVGTFHKLADQEPCESWKPVTRNSLRIKKPSCHKQ